MLNLTRVITSDWNRWKLQFNQVLSILDRFDPFWTDLIHFGQTWSNLMKKGSVIFILMQQSTIYSTELHISSKSNSFVIINCCQLWHLNSVSWFEKLLFSAVYLRHTMKTAVDVRRTAENCGFLNHKKNFWHIVASSL